MNAKQMMVEKLLAGESILKYREGGNSMTPLIKSRQPVDIRPVDRELRKGDIVFARVSGRFFMHLVSALDGDRVQISNNHGHVNGWTTRDKIYGFVSVSEA
jgi:hypothetical protein